MHYIHKIIIALIAMVAIAGCTPAEQGAVVGGAAGAAIGGIATGDVGGAVVGGAVGAVAGAVIGHVTSRPGYCYYHNRYGHRYVRRCPVGY